MLFLFSIRVESSVGPDQMAMKPSDLDLQSYPPPKKKNPTKKNPIRNNNTKAPPSPPPQKKEKKKKEKNKIKPGLAGQGVIPSLIFYCNIRDIKIWRFLNTELNFGGFSIQCPFMLYSILTGATVKEKNMIE